MRRLGLAVLLVLVLVVVPEVWPAVFPRLAPVAVLWSSAPRRLVSLFVSWPEIGLRARA